MRATIFAAFIFRAGTGIADDYLNGIADAQATRNTQWDASVFSSLTMIDASRLGNITVSDGAGGNKTIQAVKVITLTNYVVPYQGATPLQPFTVDTAGNFRTNLWVTAFGDIQSYYLGHNLPTTNNTEVTNYMQQALGMNYSANYQALSFYVEPKYLTRPSFAPSVTANTAPAWNATNYTYTNVLDANPEFWGFAPTTVSGDGKYVRPFASFQGLGDAGTNYENWMNSWSTASYNLAGGREFPFTGLGWTWNWNPNPSLNGFALSEFIVSGNATYYYDNLTDAINLVPEPTAFWLLLISGATVLLLKSNGGTVFLSRAASARRVLAHAESNRKP